MAKKSKLEEKIEAEIARLEKEADRLHNERLQVLAKRSALSEVIKKDE